MFVTRQSNIWWVLGVCVVCLWVMWRLDNSRYGLAATVVHEDPQVASSLGINPNHIQRIGFVLSGALGGIAGVLMADQLQFIGPNTYYIDLAFTMLAAVVLGGAYHWFGAMVGAMVFRFLPELLRDYVSFGDQIANGVLLVVIMIYLPRGIIDPSRRKRRERRLWQRAPAASKRADPPDAGADDSGAVRQHRRSDIVTDTGTNTGTGTGMPALSLVDLGKHFGGLRAVDGLTFAVPPASIFGIMGPNGAGKTTVLNLVSGYLKPDHGSIEVFGTSVGGQSAHRVARSGVARTYQNVRLFPALTVLETVISGFYAHRSAKLWQSVLWKRQERREKCDVTDKAQHLLERVGVSAPSYRVAETLPYGEQRRVEIARRSPTDPRGLLLDEPTAGMNRSESEELGGLMRDLCAEGLTLVLIEHNVKLVLDYCSSAVVINFGELIAQGTPL